MWWHEMTSDLGEKSETADRQQAHDRESISYWEMVHSNMHVTGTRSWASLMCTRISVHSPTPGFLKTVPPLPPKSGTHRSFAWKLAFQGHHFLLGRREVPLSKHWLHWHSLSRRRHFKPPPCPELLPSLDRCPCIVVNIWYKQILKQSLG